MTEQPEQDIRRAEGNMDEVAGEMRRDGEQVETDIDKSRERLDTLRSTEGTPAEDVTGDWQKDPEDERGDQSGPGRWKAARQ